MALIWPSVIRSVLRDGAYIGDAAIADINEQQLVSMMVGREISNMYGTRDPAEYAEVAKREPIFVAKDLHKMGKYFNVNFSVRPGEIVGLSGLVGAGRTETVRAIFGMDPKDDGKIFIEGKENLDRYLDSDDFRIIAIDNQGNIFKSDSLIFHESE